MSKIDDSLPSNKFLKLTQPLTRKQASLLLQLRTGHTALNGYLHRISRSPMPLCPACELETETVHHYLVACPARCKQRRPLEKALGYRTASSVTRLLTVPKALPHLFSYIQATRRLVQTSDSVAPPA